jgi:hypothetical protein
VRGPTVAAGDEAIQRVNEFGARLQQPRQIVDMFTHVRLATMVAPDDQLPEVLATGFEALRALPLSDDPEVRPLCEASVHLAEREPAMTHRIKFPSVWLRFDYDERLASGETLNLGRGADDDPGFASAFDLHSGMLMFDSYFGPLAGCLSPYIWCLVIPRTRGVIVIDLGTTLSGTRSQAAELLDTLPVHGPVGGVRRPEFDSVAFGAAVAWWTDRLDALFGVLSDPSVFADRGGRYRAASHLHALLTVEQLFLRTMSIQSAARDTHAARVLLFSVLDTLQRLTGRPLETHCSAEFARKTLGRLHEVIPATARDVLLWSSKRAVGAITEVQDGFFLRSMDGDRVVIRAEGKPDKELTLDEAAAHYLKVIRDATHGHGSNKDNAKSKTNALLVQHNGQIPHDIAGLAFMYMLDVLSRPLDLRSTLAGQAARG